MANYGRINVKGRKDKLTATGAEWGGTGGGGLLPPLALNAPMITSGDSWASTYIQYTGANDNRSSRWGVLTALMEYMGHKWRVTRLGHKAVSGTTSTQILTQTTNAIATLPGGVEYIWFCPERFLNDVATAKTAAQASADWDTDIAKVRATTPPGRCVIGTCPPPATGNSFTAPQLQKITDYNVLVRAKAARDVKVIDYDTFGLVDADFADPIHLKTNGWDKIAPFIVTLLAPWTPSGDAFTNFPGTIYTVNPGMTGGTTSPTNWPAITITGGGGATATWAAADQSITFGGTVVGAGKVIDLQQLTGTGSFPVTGDNIEAIFKVTFPAATAGLLAVNIQPIFYTSGFSTLAQGYASTYAPPVAETAVSMARPAGEYVMRVPPVPIASGTVAYTITTLHFNLLDDAGAINFKLSNLRSLIGKVA